MFEVASLASPAHASLEKAAGLLRPIGLDSVAVVLVVAFVAVPALASRKIAAQLLRLLGLDSVPAAVRARR